VWRLGGHAIGQVAQVLQICRETLAEEPLRGTAFVFRNRRASAVKFLAYDDQGFSLCQKRVSTGRLGLLIPPSPPAAIRREVER
jgi:hypothetical protein